MKKIWYRGFDGDDLRQTNIWLSSSRKYAAFFGSTVCRCTARGPLLDLTRLGTDWDADKLIDAGVPPRIARREPGSGEMHEWAEKSVAMLHEETKYRGVIVMQWHYKFSQIPQKSALMFDRADVDCVCR